MQLQKSNSHLQNGYHQNQHGGTGNHLNINGDNANGAVILENNLAIS